MAAIVAVDDAFHAKWKEQRWVETTRDGDFEGCIKDMGINAAGAKIINFVSSVKTKGEFTLTGLGSNNEVEEVA